MPVIAIVAGVAGAAAGAGAFVGAVGLAKLAAGMAIVGGVSTALGAVTGNKKLMKFGAVVGLGGAALGGIASLSGAASKAAGGAAGSSFSLADAAGNSGNLGLKVGSGSGLGLTASTAGQGLQATGLLNSAASAVPSFAASSYSLSAPSSQAMIPAVAGPNTVPSLAVKAPSANPISLPDPGSATSGFDTAKGMLSNFGKYLKDNPELTKVGLGAMDGMSRAKASQDEFDTRQRQLDADRARYNASILNQSSRF